jgi:Dolichyl-phosphate-mannose-protein mannosyltransferase
MPATVTWAYVISAEIDSVTDRSVPRFATGVVVPVALVVTVLHCVASTLGDEHWFDEVYMLAIGRNHLDWGSADQPPLAPALAALMDWLAPGSQLVLALPAALSTGCAVLLAGLIAREIGCDRRAQGFTAAAQATGAWATFAGHWLTPYSLEPVQWLLLFWLLVRWIRLRDDRLLIAAGVVVGFAALTKFQVMLLCAVLLAAVAVLGPRELLRRPLLWMGAGIAGLIAAPTLVWQHANGWPQLQMAPVVAGEADALYGGRPGIAVQLILFAGVAGVGLALYGLWRLFRDGGLREYRFIGGAFVVLYVLFVVTQGRPYYLVGLYAPLAAIGALALQRRREAGRTRRGWLVWPGHGLSVALAAGALIVSVSAVGSGVVDQMARRIADAYHAVPSPQRDRTALIGGSYIVAAYIDRYSDRYQLPHAYSTNRSYGYFPPPPDDLDSALYIGRDTGDLARYFTDVRKVGDIGDDMYAYLLTGQRQPWNEIWPRLRTLTVS